VTHLQEIQRFPLPGWTQNSIVLKLGSWYALLLEFSLGVLIWFKRFRYPLLMLGLLFHLCLEYALNIPMFQWDILTAYVLFIDPADLTRVWRCIRCKYFPVALLRRSRQSTPPIKEQGRVRDG
jgi:Vitamin K-dependent gamma-carboxylase